MGKGRCVMVLGIPRSGTSLVAGVLHRLGVDMGQGHLQPSDINNPTGYYEDLRWQHLHKRITGIRYGTGHPDQIDKAQKDRYRELAEKCQQKPLWGQKCPRLCFTAQWVWPYLSDCRVVAVRRDFGASVASLVRHSEVSYKGELRMDAERARSILGMWHYCFELRLAEFQGPVLEVQYRDVLKDADTWVRALARFSREGLVMEGPSNKQILAAVSFCQRGMDHHGQRDGIYGRVRRV